MSRGPGVILRAHSAGHQHLDPQDLQHKSLFFKGRMASFSIQESSFSVEESSFLYIKLTCTHAKPRQALGLQRALSEAEAPGSTER